MRIRSTTVDGHQFTRTRRGYDANEVDAVMTRISATLREYEEQAEDLEARIAAAQTAAKVAKPREEKLVAAEIEAAKAKAADIVRAANEEAERRRDEIAALLDEARREAESLRLDAEKARTELETAQLVEPEPREAGAASLDALRTEAMQDADAIRSQAREEAEALLSAALIEAGRLVSEAEAEPEGNVGDGHAADTGPGGEAGDEATTIAKQLEAEAREEAEAMLLVALDEAARMRDEAAGEAAELRSVMAADVAEQRSALAEAARVHAEAEELRRDLEEQIEQQRTTLADTERTRAATIAEVEELMAAALIEADQIRAEAKADADEIRHRAAVEAAISPTGTLDEPESIDDRRTVAALHAAELERREMGRRLESLATTVLTIERRLAALSAAAASPPQSDATGEHSAEQAGRPAAGFHAPGVDAPVGTAEPSAVHVIEPGSDIDDVDGVPDDTVTTSRAHGYAEPDGSGRPPVERATVIPEELIDPEAPDDEDDGPYRTFYQRAGRNLRERLRLEGQDPTQRGR
jgi:DivIVA domain-containing protein